MANKFEQQIIKLNSKRDDLTIKQVGLIFESIRDKSQLLAASVVASAGDNTEWFQERNRAERFAVKTNKTLRPDYLKKDRFSKDSYINEYNTAYYQSLYTITNEGISEGFLVKLPKYTEKQFKKAVNYPLSKLMNPDKMKVSRSVDIEQLYTTIVSGVEQGLSLPNINKALDINLGFRNSAGKWIKDVKERAGQTYKTSRTLRTEILRMRSTAETDQWLRQQPIVESNLQLLETLDDRTRPQSAQMDGQIANKEGKFKFPGISEPKFAHRSGKASFDINDRATTINIDPEFPSESRIERDPVTGKNKVVPYKSFEEFAKEKGMTRNKFGQELFPKKKPARTTPPKPVKSKVKPIPEGAKIKEINQWGVDNGIAKQVDFKGINPTLARETAQEMEKQISQYPRLKNNFSGSYKERDNILKEGYRPIIEDQFSKGDLEKGSSLYNKEVDKAIKKSLPKSKGIAMSFNKSEDFFTGNGVSFNPKYMKKVDDFNDMMKSNFDAGRFSTSNGVPHVVNHELGHELDSLLGLKNNQKIIDMYKKEGNLSELSSYGYANIQENIAEAWAEYKTSPNPRAYAQKMGEIIDAEYNKKFR